MKYINLLSFFLTFLILASCQGTNITAIKDFNFQDILKDNNSRTQGETKEKTNYLTDLKNINFKDVLDEVFDNKNFDESFYKEKKYLENYENKNNVFSSDNLRENIINVIENHPKYKSAVSKLNQNKAEIEVLESQKKLKTTVNTAFGLYAEDKDTDPGLTVSLNASKMVYDAGSIDQSINSARLALNVSKYEVNSVSQQIALQALKAWLNVKKSKDIYQVYSEGLSLVEPLMGQIKDISTSGITEKNSLLLAKKEFSKLQINLEKAKNANDLALKNFMTIYSTNKDISVGPIGNLNLDFNKISDEQMLLSLNEYKALEYSILSVRSKIVSVEKTKKPNIAFRAGVVAPAEKTFEDGTANAGFLVNYVYNDGGERDSTIKSLKSSLEGYESDILDLNRNKLMEFEVLKKRFKISEKEIDTYEELVELSEDLIKTSKAQLVSGRSKIQDVLDAEVKLAMNKIDLINSNANAKEALIELYLLLSGLDDFKEWNFIPSR